VQESQYEILEAALNVMVKGPASLQAALAAAPTLAGIDGEMDCAEFLALLKDAPPDDPARNLLRTALVSWDYAEAPAWAAGTLRNTRGRRDRIYQKLGIDPHLKAQIDETLPFAHVDQVIVVAKKFTPWYTEDVRRGRNFYWRAYENYLRNIRNFEPPNIETLDDATFQVMERITNPEQEKAYQAKGIVVGYVQSGKTANFTGVIAKAIDAGYRLVIVLSGTMDLLRDQTQRRIDMELVGKEQIRRHATGELDERFDYDDDPDWDTRFISYGGLPSEMGAVDIIRLTGAGQVKGSSGDFQSLKHGIQTLEIEKVEKRKPLYDPVNLHSAAVRLMVVKKNSIRLAKLVNDLKRIGSQALGEVPSLIIDDESDQASIDTIRPDKRFLESERRRRSTINQRVTDLLQILPRAQYVGYTATPFANVFVDPEDAQNIFPKDFIISLPRPTGYMGVSDFHDLGKSEDDAPEGPQVSNESAFVRGVWEPHQESTDQLLQAIDTFVLTGTIKLYRERLGAPGDFRHHTMLAHESHRQVDHEELKRLILDLWSEAGYDTGKGFDRLRRVFSMDILPTSEARAPGLPLPASVEEIRFDIGNAISRIEDGDSPVLVVNGTREADTPNFDKVPVWKVVVGGAKLSRGYTIEGLTVSYFRRRALYQDTLMQMGRWFGFRPGYRDLVRLYIGRHEPLTSARRTFIDLYEAFEAICRDEDAFRAQLRQYAMPGNGSEPLTPLQVPPLVRNSHPQLVPAAKNKMFNARLKAMNFGGEWVERTLASDRDEDLKFNEELFVRLLADSDLGHSELSVASAGKRSSFDAFYGVIGHDRMLGVLDAYRWVEPYGTNLLKLESQFLHGTAVGDPQIDDWLLLMPQLRSNRKPWQTGGYTFSSVERARVGGYGRFKAYTDPNHRKVAEVISGNTFAEAANDEVRALAMPRRRGVLLLYPVFQRADENLEQSGIPTMGFAFIPPRNELPRRAEFTVRRKDLEDQPVVDV
jgi:Z1 domain